MIPRGEIELIDDLITTVVPVTSVGQCVGIPTCFAVTAV
jgi:hypothetical protein